MNVVLYNEGLASPKVSIILLDWNCRESFHSLDYLARQDVPRSDYEIIWIEYYDRRAAEIDRRVAAAQAAGEPPPVDNWIIMGMPAGVYYHKHLMYNVGIVQARGDIVVICDSDAMFEPSFVRTVCEAFAADPGIVLHIDEIRSARRDFYPFNYPSFEEVRGKGAINWRGGKTTGLWDSEDPLHSRNYGACLCAWRRDLIAIGGADEHLDYLGHVCGPYELTFRLMNYGRREVWHPTHFIYHTWHPGTDGDKNFVGPNDGRGMSTTALAIRKSGRVQPLRENKAIRLERTDAEQDRGRRTEALIDPEYERVWTEQALAKSRSFALFNLRERMPKLLGAFGSCDVFSFAGTIWAVPHHLGKVDLADLKQRQDSRIRQATSIEAAIALFEQGELDARRLFGEDARYDVVECGGEWMGVPHTVGVGNWDDPALLARLGVIRAPSREALAVIAKRTRLHNVTEIDTAAGPATGLSQAFPAPSVSSVSRSVATEVAEPSLAAVMARLDQIQADMLAQAKRIDRIGAIAEAALLLAAPLPSPPPPPPRNDGPLMWSLRHPRKALGRTAATVGAAFRTIAAPIRPDRRE